MSLRTVQPPSIWHSLHGKAHAFYNQFKCTNEADGMIALRTFFPYAKADTGNFCLFSTSGTHGSYLSIEDVENHLPDEPLSVTFVIVQPRIINMSYGNCLPRTVDDFVFLKKLRQSSWDIVQQIGRE